MGGGGTILNPNYLGVDPVNEGLGVVLLLEPLNLDAGKDAATLAFD